ncbi:MAG: uracil-DNA glycosylase [Clostridia bacterium]|nr:uracil-DNA glycosylase [Clostridia bacterium]
MIELGGGWDGVLKDVFESENYKKIRNFLKTEYFTKTIYPPMHDLYNCFRYTPYDAVKCVILGQDPYHNPGQAHGLCFSVKDGVELPPSLKNIYKEIKDDLGITEPENYGNLTKWAVNGVLLLNTVFTVRQGAANSHKDCGWQWFTDTVIKKLSDREKPMVFMLWGGIAISKKNLIDASRHLILECAHPSPLSAFNGFFGCRHFSKCNAFLKEHGMTEIDWQL